MALRRHFADATPYAMPHAEALPPLPRYALADVTMLIDISMLMMRHTINNRLPMPLYFSHDTLRCHYAAPCRHTQRC